MLTPHLFLQSVRLPFWFACFLAVIGVAWRSPLASVVLLSLCLVLLVAIEWAVRRFDPSNKRQPSRGMHGCPPQVSTLGGTSPTQCGENVLQQIIRSKTPEGIDRLEGTFLVTFPDDTMTVPVHIPFCPAFQRVPNVQVFLADKANAGLRVISPKTFGVRVDVKRNDHKTKFLRFVLVATGETLVESVS